MLDALKITSRMKAVPTGFPAIKPTFNDYTWDEINKISEGDLWDLYGIQVGDTKTVPINFDGKSGDVDCFIIGINHNEKFEGKGATFQVGKIKGIKVGMSQAPMNSGNSTVGGWEKSLMRTKTCVDFFNALPSDLQTIIKETTKYSNNIGNDYTASAVTATKDKIFILSANEIAMQASGYYGGIKINPYEQSFQKTYDYYLTNLSLSNFDRDNQSTFRPWWLRTPVSTEKFICIVGTQEEWQMEERSANSFESFCPCFKV